MDIASIVSAAIELLDADGFDGLSMRILAQRLGVKAPSLYNHVRDKAELLTLIADALCAEVPPLDAKREWHDQLRKMARDLRGVLLAHRDGARVLAASPPVGPHRLALIEQVLRALRTAGFSPSKTVDAASVLNSYIVGFILDETQGARRDEPATDAPFDPDALRAFPTLGLLSARLLSAPADRQFDFGLRALLDGIALQRGRSLNSMR